MTSVCAEQHNKFYTSHQLFPTKKTLFLQNIDIPPRKLLNKKKTNSPIPLENNPPDMFSDSPKFSSTEETLLQKFLPYNNNDNNNNNNINEDDYEDDGYVDDDPYNSDHFRMYEFKVRRCTRSRSHDWTDCPFAHPGEKARRRDPRRYHYAGTICPEYRRGGCSRGENCEFAHGVFECWLHPARYRTEACKDGRLCRRKVCFFAHTPRELRVLPQKIANTTLQAGHNMKFRKLGCSNNNHCCMYCQSITSSPTSTLMGISSNHFSPPVSPSFSPPLSPAEQRCLSGVSPVSAYSERFGLVDSYGLNVSYKDVFDELVSAIEAMNMSEGSSRNANSDNRNLSLVDVSFGTGCEDQQQQFVMSPAARNPSGSGNFLSGGCSSKSSSIDDNKLLNDNGGSCPDLEWVNELLM